MRDVIADELGDDSTLIALLVGGIYTQPISRQTTPDAFDASSEVLPCAVVRTENVAQDSRLRDDDGGLQAAREFITVHVYQRSGHDVIDQALDRIYALLHAKRLDTGGTWIVDWVGDVPQTTDPTLGGASMAMSRYEAIRRR